MKKIYFLLLALFIFLNCNETYIHKKEAKGIWITRFAYTTELDTLDTGIFQQAVKDIIKDAAVNKFNFVLFQVRGNGTVFYKSENEPWALELTGNLGEDPGWDPLALAVEEAHKNGLEIHAWVNTFPAWRGDSLPVKTHPLQLYLAYPEWLVCDSAGTPMQLNPGYVNLSPGIPEAREHIINTVMEIVENYDVDGIHFDYIRYPEQASSRGFSMDPVSLSRFNSAQGNPQNLDWENWQREQITQFLRDFNKRAKRKKPYIKISCAVVGKYKGEGWTAFNQVYQSPKLWMEEELVDFLLPMIYWSRTRAGYEYQKLLSEWLQGNKKYVFPGIALYRANAPGWTDDEIKAEIEISRTLKTKGYVFFSSDAIEEYYKPIYDDFKYLSNFPSTKKVDFDASINSITTIPTDSSIILKWVCTEKARFYNIYRSDEFAITTTPEYLYKKVFGNSNVFQDIGAIKGRYYYYKISAVDRYGNESEPTNIIQVKF